MKRFYKQAKAAPSDNNDGYAILLDEKPIRTPSGHLLLAPTAPLAEAVATEWNAQEERIDQERMRITTLLTTAIDRSIPERSAIAQTLLKYLNGDLLCYRVSAQESHELAAEEARLWNPWLDWFALRFGHKLSITTDLGALVQSDDAHADMATYISDLDGHVFNILQIVTALSGSFVLALAFIEKQLDARGIYDASLCEELFYIRHLALESYGDDPITEKKNANLLADFQACERYLNLV